MTNLVYGYNNSQNLPDSMLNATGYGLSALGTAGIDTTKASLTVCLGQTARLAFAPETVRKPNNESAKILVSLMFFALGEQTGEKRVASLLEFVARGVIDLSIKS